LLLLFCSLEAVFGFAAEAESAFGLTEMLASFFPISTKKKKFRSMD
jgi:hypothetical protein